MDKKLIQLLQKIAIGFGIFIIVVLIIATINAWRWILK